MKKEEKSNLIDLIMSNAKVLAKLAKAVDKAESRNWNVGPHIEFSVQRYYTVRRDQENLIKQLQSKSD